MNLALLSTLILALVFFGGEAFGKTRKPKAANRAVAAPAMDPLLAHAEPWTLGREEISELLGSSLRWSKDGTAAFLPPGSATLFGGDLGLQGVELYLREGKLQRVLLNLHSSNSKVARDSEALDVLFGRCAKAAGAWSGSEARPHRPLVPDLARLPGDMPVQQPKNLDPTSTIGQEVSGLRWDSKKGVAVMDRGTPLKEGRFKSWLRLRFAAPGTPSPELFVEEIHDGFAGDFLSCPLDLLLRAPACWSMTREQFEEAFGLPMDMRKEGNPVGDPYFEWVTTTKDRARFARRPYNNLAIDLSAFGGAVLVEEAVVDFRDGKLAAINVSLANRGDSGNINPDSFAERFKVVGAEVGKLLGARPFPQRPDDKKGILTEGYLWSNETTFAALEHNEGALEASRPEFLRLRLVGKTGNSPLRMEVAKLGDLPRNVVKKDGDVFVGGVPMVDQGDKGYCVVASCQRLFEYYGIPCDQHQLAQMCGSSAETGTSSREMANALEKIDGRFKMDFKTLAYYQRVDPEQFIKDVTDCTDDGIPLIWSLRLGLYPEKPNLRPQTDGYHMRLIIGYNKETSELIFSDSWGAGHEIKRMDMAHAIEATTGLHVMRPTHR